jgi:prevent-host-death family protein
MFNQRKGIAMKIEVELQEVRERTDELLDQVEQGETIVITELGKPVAKMVPHQPEPPGG